MVFAAVLVSAWNAEAAEYRQLETVKKLSASTQIPGCRAFPSGSVTGWNLGSMANS